MSSELTEQLRRLPFFSALAPAVLEELAGRAVRQAFSPGDVLFTEGEPSRGLLLVESGRVKVVKLSPQGREQTLAILDPWEPANAVAAFTDHTNPATAIALEAVTASVLPRAAVREVLRAHPEFAEEVIRNMADHMVRLTEMVADLSLRSVAGRLARLILDGSVDGRLERPRWYTLPELAAQLGTVPDVVQRALARLVADRLVEVSRREIRVLDAAGLERVVG